MKGLGSAADGHGVEAQNSVVVCVNDVEDVAFLFIRPSFERQALAQTPRLGEPRLLQGARGKVEAALVGPLAPVHGPGAPHRCRDHKRVYDGIWIHSDSIDFSNSKKLRRKAVEAEILLKSFRKLKMMKAILDVGSRE